MKRLHVALITTAVALTALSCSGPDGARDVRIVLITLDTLRHDRFEPAAGAPSTMPLTRARAANGLVLDRYYTVSPVTQPAHATIFTGLLPWEHGITRNGIVLRDDLPNVIEAFKAGGFETHAVVASYPLASRFGFARGFDSYGEDFSHNLSKNKTLWEGHWQIESGKFFSLGGSVTDEAIEALGSATGDKQFFWFHYFDPHAPYGASSGDDVLKKRDVMTAADSGIDAANQMLDDVKVLYDRDVRYLDESLNRVFEQLERDGARYETHVVVVADHGESLGEDGSIGHGARLNQAELRVPAFILSSQVAPRLESKITSALDIAPTLLSLAGLQLADVSLAGRDLTAPITTPSRAYAIRRTFLEPGKVERRIDGRDYPLEGILFGEVGPGGVIQLGNGDALLSDNSATSEESQTRVRETFREFEKSFSQLPEALPLDDEVRRGLKALGYIE